MYIGILSSQNKIPCKPEYERLERKWKNYSLTLSLSKIAFLFYHVIGRFINDFGALIFDSKKYVILLVE